MEYIPLAERLRPQTLDEVVGQSHVLKEGALLRELASNKQQFSLIFWGPPGSGKTTLARILANDMEAEFIELSAVTAGKADVKKVVETAEVNRRLGMRTVLFVDEIHRFNKAQQDAFLPHVESGLITLIGATTENPSFEIINPLLSRSRVIVLHSLTKNELITLLIRARDSEKLTSKRLPDISLDYLAELSAGDARVALGTLELAMTISRGKVITKNVLQNAAQKRLPGYDKKGDMHYDVISAFIKSMRGSDANAALYYLARMLEADEDPKFIARRMVIFASEDIGIAASPALNLAVATFQAVERIGMPECKYNLFHCALVLSKAQKSRVVSNAMTKAIDAAKKFPDNAVPLHVRNAPTKLMKDLGYSKDYKWQADFKHNKGFLPDELANLDLFT
ncbi:MAG: replication-associated recombination protein A [bacterium]|nr:replication-associated recombination protein A [bacterium]